MNTIDTVGNLHRASGAPGGGQFTAKSNTPPETSLAPGTNSSVTSDCATCGRTPAPFRTGNISRGHRDEREPRYCERCAALQSAEGSPIERAPLPQEDGETLAWLVRGDDHEYVIVEGESAVGAIAAAARVFGERYDASCSEDLLTVVAGFRDDHDAHGELTWVPGTGAPENEALRALDEADI